MSKASALSVKKLINTAFIIHIVQQKKGIFDIRYYIDLVFVYIFYV